MKDLEGNDVTGCGWCEAIQARDWQTVEILSDEGTACTCSQNPGDQLQATPDLSKDLENPGDSEEGWKDALNRAMEIAQDQGVPLAALHGHLDGGPPIALEGNIDAIVADWRRHGGSLTTALCGLPNFLTPGEAAAVHAWATDTNTVEQMHLAEAVFDRLADYAKGAKP